jgi:galactokinase
MVEAAEGLPGYYGGRMIGGGFGGCTLNLVEVGEAEEFAGVIAERYRAAAGIEAEVYVCSAGDGAGVE